jgi:Icc protein
MTSRTVRIAQLSDTHVYANKEKTLLGVNTWESFSAVIDLLMTDPAQPDLILFSGDLSQDYSEGAYLNLAQHLKHITVPRYYVPGNHDDHKRMGSVLPINGFSDLKQIQLPGWQVILLNSQKPGCTEGFLDQAQLHFLEDCLNQQPECHALVIFHHHPAPVGSAWLDSIGLCNADELWQRLSHYSHVRAILFGHIHQEHEGSRNGILYYSAPSTCIQFKKNSQDFALEALPQGYRWIDLYPDGQLKTGVRRLAQCIGTFDITAAGY